MASRSILGTQFGMEDENLRGSISADTRLCVQNFDIALVFCYAYRLNISVLRPSIIVVGVLDVAVGDSTASDSLHSCCLPSVYCCPSTNTS